jgi:hypothetical protein
MAYVVGWCVQPLDCPLPDEAREGPGRGGMKVVVAKDLTNDRTHYLPDLP